MQDRLSGEAKFMTDVSHWIKTLTSDYQCDPAETKNFLTVFHAGQPDYSTLLRTFRYISSDMRDELKSWQLLALSGSVAAMKRAKLTPRSL